MANPQHLAVARKGAEAIAEWRRSNPEKSLDLSGANLAGADLAGADLAGADLVDATLDGADLAGANLAGADLSETRLVHADLSRANLTTAMLLNTDLWGARVGGANLTQAFLLGACFYGSVAGDADFSKASLGFSYLADVDLSRARGLATVDHLAPSSVGVDTLLLSLLGAGNQLTPELRTFFRGAGVPEELLNEIARIAAEVKYDSCFIAYGEPDKGFARKLCEDLESRGVSCWLYDMDATPGKRTWGEIERKRREAEKVVVLCSAAALVRDGVLKEIEAQIDEDPDKMVPISLDGLWKESGFKVTRGSRDLKPHLLERNYADFANLDYDEALERLLRALRRHIAQKEA